MNNVLTALLIMSIAISYIPIKDTFLKWVAGFFIIVMLFVSLIGAMFAYDAGNTLNFVVMLAFSACLAFRKIKFWG